MGFESNGKRYILNDPVALPNASSFLWNRKALLHATCRGYVSAQFLQPEPTKYTSGPVLEAATFMQPEQPYYAHHPGRFVYIKDQHSKELFSLPYEPVRKPLDNFQFICEADKIIWKGVSNKIEVTMTLTLDDEEAIECWSIDVTNLGLHNRELSLNVFFPVGYRSWMNQSADYVPQNNAIVCRAITPYQKVEQYFLNQSLNEDTVLIAQTPPDSWETRQQEFEGEGGLHNPDALQTESLSNQACRYQIPAAIMQYRISLEPNQKLTRRFVFGPMRGQEQVAACQQKYFVNEQGFSQSRERYNQYMQQFRGKLSIATPDQQFNDFVNNWLPRQLYYHGDVNRLTTDPQTRNYLQDSMGLCYLDANKSRQAFLKALSQQHASGEMPDGILLHEDASLKYINQVPHTDHCVWLPICIEAYLNESNDYGLLDTQLCFVDSDDPEPVFEHVQRAMHWLENAVDHRGLSYINQGDWCDPMNMVGYQGKGVSAWLTLASAYAFRVWAAICQQHDQDDNARYWQAKQAEFNHNANQYFFTGSWYARGITDGGRLFGTEDDSEGKMFLNPQSWAMLGKAVKPTDIDELKVQIEQHLQTPFGPVMLAPSYTEMVEDIGRVTQKYPGTAENGSVYNHAVCFYIYALYEQGDADRATRLLLNMLPQSDDFEKRGQLPIFIPNYYRGAYHQFPEQAGKSSQLFNTGTIAWYYRCLVDGLLGLRGCKEGLIINPQLPSYWQHINASRQFRGASCNFEVTRSNTLIDNRVTVNGQQLNGNVLQNLVANQHYEIVVELAKNED